MSADKEQKAIGIADHITRKLGPLSSQLPKQWIFEVHDRLKRVNEEAYKPKTICIGPYYCHKRCQNKTLEYRTLKLMEEYKLRYLENFVRRTEKSVLTYVKVMQDLEERTRNCYAEPINDLNSNEFVEMMLLDSCFIVEFLLKTKEEFMRDENDPIFQVDHIRNSIIMDLLLLENQLPFFVLDEVFKMAKINLDSIISMAKSAFQNLLPSIDLSGVTILGIRNDEIEHLLGLMHYCWCFPMLSGGNDHDANLEDDVEQVPSYCCLPVTCYRRILDDRPKKNRHIKTATELQEFGIKFKRSNSGKLFDIGFDNGTILIPHLQVQDDTESIIRNLIAYEQCLPNNSPRQKYFTDYVLFMDELVNSAKDVEILRHQEIILNTLGEDEVVSKVFNKFCLEIIESVDFRYSNRCVELNNHCAQERNRWMASLRRNYFNSPWAIISILAAILLLLLTISQTVFSVLSVTDSD